MTCQFPTASRGIALLVSLLSACSGGGGGGAGTDAQVGSLSVTPSALTFTSNGAATPAQQTLTGTILGVSSGTVYVVVAYSGSAIQSVSNVMMTSANSGEVSVSVRSPAALGIGSYNGAITIRACKGSQTCSSGNLAGSPKTIPVTYSVNGLIASADQLDYYIGATATAADFARQVSITGVPAQNWTATDTVEWLTVTASGGPGDALTATVDEAIVAGMDNGDYAGSITVAPSTDGQPLVIPVTLHLELPPVPQVSYVAPYVAYTGSAGDVIIRGQALADSPITDVLFGGTPATAFTAISGTEVHATYPGTLAVGRHAVQVKTEAGAVRSVAELVVVNAPTFAAAAIPYTSVEGRMVNSIVYDAERAALGVTLRGDTSGTHFLHFASESGALQPATVKTLTNHFALTLSSDGSEWIAGNYRAIAHVDANDLTTVATVTTPIDPSSSEHVFQLAMANNGTAAVYTSACNNPTMHLYLYDVRRRRFTTPPGTSRCHTRVGASADGARLLVNDYIGSHDVAALDVATGEYATTGIDLTSFFQPVLDRTGSRIVLDRTKVYSGAYAYLGALPATSMATVLSPDGTRAHTYDSSGKMRTFDLTGTPFAGIFPEVGSGITLAADPGPVTDYSRPVMMTITPDGKSVFMAGTGSVVVQPTP